MASVNRRVGMVFSDNYRELMCHSPKFVDRFAMVMDLINAYGLVNHLVRIPPLTTSIDTARKELNAFHSADYIEAVYSLQEWHRNATGQDEPEEAAVLESFGLSYDCPGFPRVFDYALACVLGSLAAADALLRRHCLVAINWAGGWHHAKRSEAAGFCYFNDAVLAIHRLLSGFCPSPHSKVMEANSGARVLYIDLDLHHGDGVEEAFWYSARVVTFSVHYAAPGFFPGTGNSVPVDDDSGCGLWTFPNGAGRGRYSAFNLPLAEGTDDLAWSRAVLPVLSLLREIVRPSFVVVQCGADGLAGDPHHIFNLTNGDPRYPRGSIDIDPADQSHCVTDALAEPVIGSYVNALRSVLSWTLPTLVLGGGGYNFPDTARLWTKLTATAIESTHGFDLSLSPDIPDHSYLSRYGADLELYSSSLPKINRSRDASDVCAHHTRLLEQACAYCELNHLPYEHAHLHALVQKTLMQIPNLAIS